MARRPPAPRPSIFAPPPFSPTVPIFPRPSTPSPSTPLHPPPHQHWSTRSWRRTDGSSSRGWAATTPTSSSWRSAPPPPLCVLLVLYWAMAASEISLKMLGTKPTIFFIFSLKSNQTEISPIFSKIFSQLSNWCFKPFYSVLHIKKIANFPPESCRKAPKHARYRSFFVPILYVKKNPTLLPGELMLSCCAFDHQGSLPAAVFYSQGVVIQKIRGCSEIKIRNQNKYIKFLCAR